MTFERGLLYKQEQESEMFQVLVGGFTVFECKDSNLAMNVRNFLLSKNEQMIIAITGGFGKKFSAESSQVDQIDFSKALEFDSSGLYCGDVLICDVYDCESMKDLKIFLETSGRQEELLSGFISAVATVTARNNLTE